MPSQGSRCPHLRRRDVSGLVWRWGARMLQLTQKLKDGAMDVLEVAVPQVSRGFVLVKNHYSLISAGTEASTVTAARKGLIGKALERPQQVKQVIDTLIQQGPVQTYRAVMKKLDAYSPLGYSAAGEVIAVASDVPGFSIGDRVACAGAGYASHAEVIAVPANLCVKLPPQADLGRAAYNTLGAIALQGVRQADLKLGETCVVIGLGLLGQLTCLMLRASGVRVVGLDIDPAMVDLARKHCADLSLISGAPGVAETITEFSGGIGADAVIITAATSSLEPINFAGRVLRKRGTVVVVGSVPTGFDRDPYFYRKELSLKMSCSYGPGRYDLDYEEKGHDYPAAYVRWTENRNMSAFQDLVHSGRINLDYLTTHRFKLDDAPRAYDLITAKTEPYLGIVIEYDAQKSVQRAALNIAARSTAKSKANIAFVGAGSYAMSNLLPNISSGGDVRLKGVLTSSGTSARTVAEKFGFEFCAGSADDIFDNAEIDTVFVATRHDSHARYVMHALAARKNVFVEKPLCLTEDELGEIDALYQTLSDQSAAPLLMVGFNRRFSPLVAQIKQQLGTGPMSMLYRINAGAIPADSWIQDIEIGGGRIIGEVCHFVDLLIHLNGSLPTRVCATALDTADALLDTVNITLQFANGSTGVIAYYANGSKSLAKEYLEVYRAGSVAVLRDFKELEINSSRKPQRKMLLNQNKGQAEMVQAFVGAVTRGAVNPVPYPEIRAATLTTFKIIEAIKTRSSVDIAG